MALRVLEKKLKRVREMRTDSQAMLESLDTLATLYAGAENTIETRRNLRADLESHGLELMTEFMQEFEAVKGQFDRVKAEVDSIHQQCDSVLASIDSSAEERDRFLAQANDLCMKRDAAAAKAEAMETFMEKFHLSAEQMECLSKGPDESDPQASSMFFDTLHHVSTIREESHALLQTQFQSAGLEIFDVMARNQNAAHKVLFEWVQKKCAQFTGDSPEPSPILCRALRALRPVEAYYKLSMEQILRARKGTVVRKFRNALVHGDKSGQSRPIQMNSHDPVRYLGDILAWLHQAVAFEKDLFCSLCVDEGSGEGKAAGGGIGRLDDGLKTVVADMLSAVFKAMNEPMEGQVQQMLDTLPQLVPVYKIANMLSFYAETIGHAMMIDAASEEAKAGGIVEKVQELSRSVLETFFQVVKAQTEKLLSAPPAYPSDLSVSVEVLDMIRRLSELLEIYNQSLTESEGPSAREEAFSPVLDALINPLIKLCKASASGLDRVDAGVYIINNIYAIQEVLTPYDFTASYVQRLTMEIGDWIDHLVAEQTKLILTRCDLVEKLSVIQNEQISKLSEEPGMDASSLQDALSRFYQMLFSLLLPEFDRLNNPRLRESARTSTARSLSSSYEKLYARVSAPESGYSVEEVERILVHKPEQVAKYILNA